MPTVDRLGRRRQPAQHRGLRSLFPVLPPDCQSRLMRVAMSAAAWARLESLVATGAAPTPPRALGMLIESWLSAAAPRPAAFTAAPSPPERDSSSNWQVWQMRKELALLASSQHRAAVDSPTVH